MIPSATGASVDPAEPHLEAVRLAVALAGRPAALWEHDLTTGTMSPEGRAVFGIDEAMHDLFGFLAWVHPDDRDRVATRIAEVFTPDGLKLDAGNERLAFRATVNQEQRWIEAYGRAVPGPDGQPARVVGVMLDVTDERRAQDALQSQSARLRDSEDTLLMALEAARLATFAWDIDAGVVHWSANTAELVGHTPDARGNLINLGVHPQDREGLRAALGRAAEAARLEHECRVIRPDGTLCWMLMRGATTPSSPRLLRGIVMDITERRVAEASLATQSTTDALTGLPNRAGLTMAMAAAIDAREPHGAVALLVIDLDGFKEINDTFGYRWGDQVLHEAAPRLAAMFPPGATVARLGSDEFAALLPATEARVAVQLAQQLVGALGEPIPVEGYPIVLSATVGIAVLPDHAASADDLLRRADVALNQAKLSPARLALYEERHDTYRPERVALVGELRRGLESEIVLDYQPIVDLQRRCVVAVEALARWDHPRRGRLEPAEFIPVAESSGLIAPLTYLVLARAAADCATWRRDGFELVVSVNLSARVIQDPQLVPTLQGLLHDHGLPPGSIELELTESAIMASPDAALPVLQQLVASGVPLAIDDFGTGYSSLAYLRRLPVASIKIDRTFVQDVGSDDNDTAIVRSIIELAHTLDRRVIAEGVWNESVAHQVAAMGVDAIQGHWVSRPIAAEFVATWLARATWPPRRVRPA